MKFNEKPELLTESELASINGGMFAVTTGAHRPLISPPKPANFSYKDFSNRVAGGAVAGGIKGLQSGDPRQVVTGTAAGGLTAGMGYCATHSTGSGQTLSSNLNSWKTSPSHSKPMLM
jgi:hypothetical protein